MPNPENLKNKGFDKNPQNINRNGRPRKLVSHVNKELEKQGVTEATKTEIVSCYLRLINLDVPEIERIANTGDDFPAIYRIVANAIISDKGFEVIEKILDRGIGKATDNIKHSGEVKSGGTIRFVKSGDDDDTDNE